MLVVGLLAWLFAGAVIGSVAALGVGWSNGMAIAGGGLSVGAIGWAVGPFKSPMAWSEGALMSYQGNAESPAQADRRNRRPWLAIPALALGAGLLLLLVAAVVAA